MEQTPGYLTAAEVLAHVREASGAVIVDVREDDRAGGHIKGSHHVPAPQLLANPSRYLYLANDTDVVIFHCMFSQYRGPACAKAFIQSLMVNADLDSPTPQVYILSGGFQAFAKLAKQGNMDAVEDFSHSLYA